MRSMVDTPRVFGKGYRMNMNKEVASAINVGLDGQTKAYINVRGKLAKDLFSSKYVPMTDGTDMLTSAPQRLFSQKGYGAIPSKKPADVPNPTHRIGFNNTLVSTDKGKINASCAYTKTFPNHTVYTDFPKGPGGVEPNPMWEDGTYGEMMEAVVKVHNALPADLNFEPVPDARKAQFNLQALSGASVYGDALFRQNLNEGLAMEEDISLEGEIRALIPGATNAEVQARKKQVRIDREAVRIAKQMRLDKDSDTVRAMATSIVEAKDADFARAGAFNVSRGSHLGRQLQENRTRGNPSTLGERGRQALRALATNVLGAKKDIIKRYARNVEASSYAEGPFRGAPGTGPLRVTARELQSEGPTYSKPRRLGDTETPRTVATLTNRPGPFGAFQPGALVLTGRSGAPRNRQATLDERERFEHSRNFHSPAPHPAPFDEALRPISGVRQIGFGGRVRESKRDD